MVSTPARAVGRLAAARHRSLRCAALVLSATLTACGGWWDDKPQAEAGGGQAGPVPVPITLSSTSLGDLEIDISGIGTKTASGAARWDQDSLRRRALATSSGADTKSTIQEATPVAGGLDLKVSSISTIDTGGFRYLTATFLVRNAQSCGTPGTCPAHLVPRTNITFLAVIGSNIAGTPFSRFLRQDDSPAEPGLAAQLLPSHGMTTAPEGAAVDGRLASMQVFREAELPPNASPTELLPYGYVVSNVNDGSRTLPANPGPNQYDGWVTFGYRIPLQAVSANNPFKMTLRVRAVEDSNTRVTQSLEESDASVMARAAALGATEIVVPCNRVSQVNGGLPVCDVRVAGSAGSVLTYLSAPPPTVTAKVLAAPTNLHNVARTAAVALGTNLAMNPPTASSLVVHGSMSGTRTLTGAYAGELDGGGSSGKPNQLIYKLRPGDRPFFRGESVSFSATSGNTATGGGALEAFVGAYRTAGALPGSQGTFPTAKTTSDIGSAADYAVGDFDGDGIQDIAYVYFSFGGPSGGGGGIPTSFVGLLRGKGDGTFASGGLISCPGVFVPRLTAGDLDGDGRQDLVLYSAASSNVIQVLRGSSSGLQQAGSVSVGQGAPFSVAIGDINGDGIADIVFSQPGPGSFGVMLGLGNLTYSPADIATSGVPSSLSNVRLRLLNSDEHLDLVATVAGTNEVAVLLGNGDGTFGTANLYAVGTNPTDLALADFSGDGRLDLVTANEGSGNLSLLVNNGSGQFLPAIHIPVAPGATRIALGTFGPNARNGILTNAGSLLYGTSSLGQFDLRQVANSGRSYVALLDATSDNRNDIVAIGAGRVSVYAGTSNGDFDTPQSFSLDADHVPYGKVAMGDINGDGYLDIVFGYSGSAPNSSGVGVVYGPFNSAGVGSGTTYVNLGFGSPPGDIALADVDKDGRLDILTCETYVDSKNVWVVRLVSTTPTTDIAQIDSFGITAMVTGDFNGDGMLDLAVANAGANNIQIFLGDGAGNFTAAASSGNWSGARFPVAMAVGDVNRDGKLDLVVTLWDGSFTPAVLVTLHGDEAGGFVEHSSVPVGVGGESIALGDFNGDGILDAVVSNSRDGTLSVLRGLASGGFSTSPTVLASGRNPYAVTLADVNGDGHLDIVVSDANNSEVLVFRGFGTGSFSALARYAVGSSPAGIAVGDLNGDGRLDVVVGYQSGANEVWVLPGR